MWSKWGNKMKILLLFVSLLQAKEIPIQKRVDSGLLHRELEAAGFSVNGITCRSSGCNLSMADSELKDPAAVIAAHDPDKSGIAREALIAELAVIATRLDDNTATAADMKRAIVIILKLDGKARK